jgi:ABC-type multidrug transport system permease subunit
MTATFIHPLTGFIEKTFVITEFELRKLRHDFTELITRALQPALWLLIFGQVFARSGAMHTGNIPYLDFIAPGILAATLFSTFSLVIACIVKTRERFMGVGQVLTMPLFFASNAIYPTDIMPAWLKAISHLNPLTYVVDALRTCMLASSPSSFGLGLDYAVILFATAVLVFIGAKLYPRLAT